ncbi:hypothetical protein BDM02DRAFT_3118877 [Thelephora ganbajun]|uniref:Uncharacterized protein n=1 Tax=Thelephora ganbajun TaxID=370292 RepID=A0ACB6ZAA0_THEGA|nr:hypothetical protein BDM02DRAFT_3118877 [Thelephora ganbajun]
MICQTTCAQNLERLRFTWTVWFSKAITEITKSGIPIRDDSKETNLSHPFALTHPQAQRLPPSICLVCDDTGSRRDMKQCRSHPIPTPRTCLWAHTASVIGLILSVDASATATSVLPPGSVLVLCTLINTRLDYLSNHGTPNPSGGDACGGACFSYAATARVGVACILRVRLAVVISFSRGGPNYRTGDSTRQYL